MPNAKWSLKAAPQRDRPAPKPKKSPVRAPAPVQHPALLGGFDSLDGDVYGPPPPKPKTRKAPVKKKVAKKRSAPKRTAYERLMGSDDF